MNAKYRNSVTVYSDEPVDIQVLAKAVQKFGRVSEVSSHPVSKWDGEAYLDAEEAGE